MSLQRFTETYVFNPQTVGINKHTITESEIKGISGSSHLSENVKKFFEDKPFTVLEGKQVWNVPVSRYDWKNANGRIYPKALWEQVIEKQRDTWQGGQGLADHPLSEADGSFKDVSVVWLNMSLNEDTKTVWAECIFVGKNGKLAEEIMEAGGKVGFSSSGFGELSEDKVTVNPATFLIERVADIVLNPSQNVFGEGNMKVTKESTEKETNETPNLQEGVTKKEEKIMSTKLSKFEERNMRDAVAVYLTEAERTKNLQERLTNLEEVLAYFGEGELPDLKEKVLAKIEETTKSINKAVAEYENLEETFGTGEVERIKEGIKNVAVDTKLFKRDGEEWKRLALGLQEEVRKRDAIIESLPTADAYKTALVYSKRLKEIAKGKEKTLLAEIAKRDKALEKSESLRSMMINELKKVSGEKQELVEKLTHTIDYTKKLKETLEDIAEKKEQARVMREKQIAEKNKIVIAPQKKYGTNFKGFNESSEIADYYSDLVETYGDAIVPFKESILGKKTMKEAMQVAVSAFADFDSARTTKLHEGIDTLDSNRQKILEEQIGVKFTNKQSRFEKSLAMFDGQEE